MKISYKLLILLFFTTLLSSGLFAQDKNSTTASDEKEVIETEIRKLKEVRQQAKDQNDLGLFYKTDYLILKKEILLLEPETEDYRNHLSKLNSAEKRFKDYARYEKRQKNIEEREREELENK